MKKFLSIALALLMVCVMLPVVALADGTSLPAPDANGVITLEKDVTLTSTWKITSDVTLDLNGKKLNIEIADSGNAVEVEEATLTVKDSTGNGEMALSKHGADERYRILYGCRDSSCRRLQLYNDRRQTPWERE